MATTNQSPKRLTPTQARRARRERHDRKKRVKRIAIFSVIGVVAFIFIIGLFLPGLPIGVGGGGHRGGGGGLFGRGAPDGPGQRFAELTPIHVSPGQSHEPYNTVPATSGAHFGQPLAPVAWRIYTEPLQPEQYLHNLEHGGIAVFYNCPDGCPELVAQLTGIVDEALGNGAKILMAPHPDAASQISLVAWTFLDEFDVFDEDRVREFVNNHESSPNSPEPNAR